MVLPRVGTEEIPLANRTYVCIIDIPEGITIEIGEGLLNEREEASVVQGIAHRKKQYVEVIAHHDEEGVIAPLTITWEDGRHFEIDEILDRRRAAALKVGGTGTRYLVRIGGRETFLYYENPRWFVEAIVFDEAS